MSGERPPNGTAIYGFDDDTLRWSPADRLDANDYALTRAVGFKWWPGQRLYVATWTPEREDHLLERVAVIDHEASEDDPDGRAQRFASRAARAEQRASERRQMVNAITEHIPLGQPYLRDHPSAKRHRRDMERIDHNTRKAVEESQKADYWQGRAQGTERRARQKSDPGVIRRRIERLEADLRRVERQVQEREAAPAGQAVYSPALGRDYTEAELTGVREAAVLRARRWAEHLDLRLTFERARLEATGADVLTLSARDKVVRSASFRKGVKSAEKRRRW